ncbi:CIC11C00000005803 [Sungouiella intermedia]|uniref:Putative transcription factor kapC n=1 Tax=Sungouiella intermedia TaxID=45354 RepID=A0A1L0BHW8_9ASCO|nr:CIC11C00000005803 [[Candida] intermedia]
MNSDYSWKEAGQIDPSFARTENDYVVPEVSLGRAEDERTLGSSSMKSTDGRISATSTGSLSASMSGNLTSSGLTGGITGPNMTSGNIPNSLTEDSGQSMDTGKEKGISGRRHVSTTKRAAQNRNAQKAFRQRREKYVKELEATAAEVAELHKTIEELRQENLQLRDYTLALQSRLIELSPNVTVGNVAHPQATEFNKL